MKVNVTFECTPEEMRAVCGLPDVQPLQDTIMTELQNKLKTGLGATDPAELFRSMLNRYMGGVEQLQGFLNRIEQASANRRKE